MSRRSPKFIQWPTVYFINLTWSLSKSNWNWWMSLLSCTFPFLLSFPLPVLPTPPAPMPIFKWDELLISNDRWFRNLRFYGTMMIMLGLNLAAVNVITNWGWLENSPAALNNHLGALFNLGGLMTVWFINEVTGDSIESLKLQSFPPPPRADVLRNYSKGSEGEGWEGWAGGSLVVVAAGRHALRHRLK